MSRNKRKTSALQAVAVTTISALFILTALFGLYKCFSQEPTLRPSGPAAPDPDPSAAQEPEIPQTPLPEEEDEHDGFPEPEEDDPLPPAVHDFTQEEYDQTVADTLDSIIEDGMTPMEQAKAVFTYVHNNIRYISHSDKSDWMNGAYAGLTTGKGDCFTYYAVSRALLTALEIDNLEVQRTGGKTQHFWNLVNCGDGWYHFDACPRSIKMPSFYSFMVTDEQGAAFTAPVPPYSLGTHMPMTPRLNSFSMFSRGYSLFRSVSAAMGFTSFSVNSAIIFRISWCSRLKLKSM